jgi:methylenetetrahydrofolate reductase (NADPH)
VGASLRYLKKNRSIVSRLATPGGYDPLELLGPLSDSVVALGIEDLHVFTFNQVARTAQWRTDAIDNAHSLAPLD